MAEFKEIADDSEEEFYDADEEPDSITLRFKNSFLKNKQHLEKQLLEVVEFDPQQIFEHKTDPENEVDCQTLQMAMEQQTIPFPNDDVDNKILHLSKSMVPVEGHEKDIFKRLVVKGIGSCPPPDSIVVIHYNAYVEDESSGEIVSFDSSVLRGKPLSFMRGQGSVIAGLDIAVGEMKNKEQSEFIFSPNYAYGKFGCPPRIPMDAYVYFKVELLEWIDSCDAAAFSRLPKQSQKDASFEQVLGAVKAEKRLGIACFEKQNYYPAVKHYQRALDWIGSRNYKDEEEEAEGQKLCLALHLDLALTYLRLNKPRKTCINCQEALRIDPNNAKAHYRYGLAQHQLGNSQRALHFLKEAQKICPKDPSINKAILEVSAKIKQDLYIEKDLYKKMMGMEIETSGEVVPVSEEFKLWASQKLEEFLRGDQPTWKISRMFTNNERIHLETMARRHNLKFSVSVSVTNQNILVISK